LKTFEELDLIEPLRRALAEEKYTTPTPIQAQTIPSALDRRDVLGCAQTGTGKTAAFALPILNHLGQRNRKATPKRPLVLVLAPTRELAIQIEESFATYGRHLRLRRGLVYGGVGQANQVRVLSRGAHILVATPGRLLDLMNQGHIELHQLEVFVLDEADRMLDMGFLPDLKRIISKLPRKRQSLFFSATMPPKIVQLSQQLLTDPISVNVTPKRTSVERIEQRVLFVERGGKLPLLRNILSADDAEKALVFTKTKRGANALAAKLDRSGIKSTAIHGNKSQGARQRALEDFRTQRVQVLVATDVAARGIDIDGVTHVVNYDLPIEPESYVHRIGRTGRAGAEGIALSFCTSDERSELRAIERFIGQKVPHASEQPKPSPLGKRSAKQNAKPSHSKPNHNKTNNSKPNSNSNSNNGAKSKPSDGAPATAPNASGEGKPKRRRRRKGRNARLREKQASS